MVRFRGAEKEEVARAFRESFNRGRITPGVLPSENKVHGYDFNIEFEFKLMEVGRNPRGDLLYRRPGDGFISTNAWQIYMSGSTDLTTQVELDYTEERFEALKTLLSKFRQLSQGLYNVLGDEKLAETLALVAANPTLPLLATGKVGG